MSANITPVILFKANNTVNYISIWFRKFFSSSVIQSDQSTRAKSAGNDYSRNILKIFILVTSVVSNYPKECPLTKIFDEDAILGDKKFFWPELRRLPATTEKYRKGSRYLYSWSSVIQILINIFIDFLTNNTLLE